MKEMEEKVAIKGVHCHGCKKFVRKGRQYYQDVWYDYGRKCYNNHCVTCAAKEIARFVAYTTRVNAICRKLRKQYSRDDRKMCLSCMNKFKQVVGDCNPWATNCKYKPMNGRKNDNKNSKAVKNIIL